MKIRTQALILVLTIGLSACYNSKSLDPSTEPLTTDSIQKPEDALRISIMHVDMLERIVTLKSYSPLEPGFYFSIDKNGHTSSAFKLNSGATGSLHEADILEGRPRISDTVDRASSEESDTLSLKYNDPKVD